MMLEVMLMMSMMSKMMRSKNLKTYLEQDQMEMQKMQRMMYLLWPEKTRNLLQLLTNSQIKTCLTKLTKSKTI